MLKGLSENNCVDVNLAYIIDRLSDNLNFDSVVFLMVLEL